MTRAEFSDSSATGLEFIEQRDQVLQIAPEAIEPPADEHVEPPPPGIRDESIERRPAVLRAADAAVDVF